MALRFLMLSLGVVSKGSGAYIKRQLKAYGLINASLTQLEVVIRKKGSTDKILA